jgi:hypothetical protein
VLILLENYDKTLKIFLITLLRIITKNMPQFNLIYCFDYFIGCLITWGFLYIVVSYYFLPFIIVFYHINLYLFLVLRFLVFFIFFKDRFGLISYNYYHVFNNNNKE